MEKTLLKKAAIQSVALMMGVIMLSYAIKQYNAVAIMASNNEDVALNTQTIIYDATQEIPHVIELEVAKTKEDIQTSERPRMIFTDTKTDISNDILEQLGEQYLVIKKPQGEDLQFKLEDLYITKSLRVAISGRMTETMEKNFIGRVNREDIYLGEPIYTEVETMKQNEDGTETPVITLDYANDPVSSIVITSESDGVGYSDHEIMLQFNHVYVHILYEDEHYYYIDLRRPKEVYEKILVIDSGHGGKNPGAISKDGNTYEKDINLKILLNLKEYLDKDNVKVYYTMLMDETLFLRPRVNLANDVDCDFFISIHCNSSTSNRPNGNEILYYDHQNKKIKTKDLAKIFSEEIGKNISLKNSGILQMKNDDVLILNHATVPAIMVETGYLSNLNDLEYLKSQEGQIAMARGIYNGIWRAYAELMPFQQADE